MKNIPHSFLDNTIQPDLKDQIEFERSNLNALINNLTGIMWSIDREYKLITANYAFEAMVTHISGRRIEIGDSVFGEGFTEDQLSRFKQYYDRAFDGETFTVTEYVDTPFERWSEISFHPIWQGYSIIGTAGYAHDITQSKLTEAKLVRANRLYQFISQVNLAIIYAKDEQTLFSEICRIAVDTGGFELACLDVLDIQNRKLHLVAQTNATPADVALFSDISYTRNGPIDKIINNNKYYAINDFSLEPEQSFWRQYAFSRDFKSAISLPINLSGGIKYLLCLFSGKANIFDREELTLLEKTVADISFALDVFEKERQRLKTAKVLAHKESRLKHAQEVAHVGYWELDFSTRIATWSEEHCRIYGVDTQDNQHSYESWLSFVHPDDREYVVAMSTQGEASLKSFSFYHRIIRKDGTMRYIHCQNEFEFNEQGMPAGMFGASQDVTEAKEAEEKLKHNEHRLKQAQAIAHFGSWQLDFSTGLAVWSEEACRIYGLAPEDNIQSYEAWVSFIHPDDLHHVMKENSKANATKSNSSIYHRIVRRDGSIRHLHSRAHFEFNNEGKPIGLYGTAHDITETIQAEERLRHSEHRLKQSQAVAHFGSWEMDLSTGATKWSDETCKIYGVAPDDDLHSYDSWLSFIHPDDLQYVAKVTADAQATLTNSDFYHRIKRKDGTERHIHTYAYFEYDSFGKPTGLYGVAHDITEQKTNIIQLKAQNEQLKEIAWIQSHKIRGPLATMLGITQLFKSGYYNNTEEIVDGILMTSEKLDAVIHEIVDKTHVTKVNDTYPINA